MHPQFFSVLGITGDEYSSVICVPDYLYRLASEMFERRHAQMRTALLTWSALSFCFRIFYVCHWLCLLCGRKGVLGQFTWQSAEQPHLRTPWHKEAQNCR